MGEPEAEKFAAAMAKAAGSAKNIKQELSASAKLMQSIAQAREEDAVDRGGRNAQRAQAALSSGNFRKAEQAAARIREGETETRLRGVGDDRDRRAITDIAKDFGLSREKDETTSEFKQRIIAARDGVGDGAPAVDKPGQGGRTDKDAKGGDKTKSSLDTLVEDIKTLLEKIEPRLPVAALTA
jgi:hypothetical protein